MAESIKKKKTSFIRVPLQILKFLKYITPKSAVLKRWQLVLFRLLEATFDQKRQSRFLENHHFCLTAVSLHQNKK